MFVDLSCLIMYRQRQPQYERKEFFGVRFIGFIPVYFVTKFMSSGILQDQDGQGEAEVLQQNSIWS